MQRAREGVHVCHVHRLGALCGPKSVLHLCSGGAEESEALGIAEVYQRLFENVLSSKGRPDQGSCAANSISLLNAARVPLSGALCQGTRGQDMGAQRTAWTGGGRMCWGAVQHRWRRALHAVLQWWWEMTFKGCPEMRSAAAICLLRVKAPPSARGRGGRLGRPVGLSRTVGGGGSRELRKSERPNLCLTFFHIEPESPVSIYYR